MFDEAIINWTVIMHIDTPVQGLLPRVSLSVSLSLLQEQQGQSRFNCSNQTETMT